MAPSLSLPNHRCLVFGTVSGNTYEPSVACAIAYSCQSQGLTIGISFQHLQSDEGNFCCGY